MSSINRQQIADGVFFSCVRDSRFKTMKLSVNLLVPLSADTASEYALLADVLTRSCKAYPDFTALSRKLCALYGADLSVNVSKMGECQLISLAAAGLDDRYALDDDSIAAELSSLLCGVIFEPNIVDGAFVPSEVEQERRQLLDTIDAEYSEKRVYAIGKLVELMCEDERFGIPRYGTVENIKAATPQALVQAWENLLKTAVARRWARWTDSRRHCTPRSSAKPERSNAALRKRTFPRRSSSWDSEPDRRCRRRQYGRRC